LFDRIRQLKIRYRECFLLDVADHRLVRTFLIRLRSQFFMLLQFFDRQCRERWVNCLDPDVRRWAWTAEEDALIAELHQRLGNRWAQMAKSLPGRTFIAIRQRWKKTLKKQTDPRRESNSSDSDRP
jgi:hypothetical protein